jgi:hypothetical protein
LFASILTLFPRFLLFIGAAASEDERRNVLTPLESFLALHFGLLLYAIAATLALSVCTAKSYIINFISIDLISFNWGRFLLIRR